MPHSRSFGQLAEVAKTFSVSRSFEWLSKHTWALILIVILGAGAVLRLRGYDASLPYLYRQHEPNMVLTALWWRGELRVFQNAYYPPLYIWLVMGVETMMDHFQPRNIPDYVRALRLISVAMDLTTTLLVALTAKRLGGKLAGALAGALWAVSPAIIFEGIIAAPDPMAFLAVSLAFYLAVVALVDPRHPWWAVASVLVGWLAILAKYPVLTAVVPGGVAGFYIWWKRDRRLGWRILAAQIAISVLIAAWMIVGLGVIAHMGDANRESVLAQQEGLDRLTNWRIVRNNISFVFYPFVVAIQANWGWVTLIAGGAAGIWLLHRKALAIYHLFAWGMLLILVFSIPWLAASFRLTATNTIRDVLPGTAAALVLCGAGVAYLVRVIAGLLQRVRLNSRYAVWIANGAALGLLCPLLVVPELNRAWQESTWRTYPDVRVALARWAEASLDPGRVIVSKDNDKTFNPYWGGYEGHKWFEWLRTDITTQTVDEWIDQGISYVAMPCSQWRSLQKTDGGRAVLDQMLLLRTFPPRAHQRGPAVAFYRLWGPQHALSVNYGDEIRLVGYDMNPDPAVPGASVDVRLYWQAMQRPSDNYSVFMHFTPADDPAALLAQVDWTPVSEQRLPLTWVTPDEVLISQPFHLDIPADLEPGTYVLRIGLYNFVTGQRLPIGETDNDHITLWSLTVEG